MNCTYDLEREEILYSVKWYKSGKEFYRYLPKEMPAAKVFPLQDINVDVSISNFISAVWKRTEKSYNICAHSTHKIEKKKTTKNLFVKSRIFLRVKQPIKRDRPPLYVLAFHFDFSRDGLTFV